MKGLSDKVHFSTRFEMGVPELAPLRNYYRECPAVEAEEMEGEDEACTVSTVPRMTASCLLPLPSHLSERKVNIDVHEHLAIEMIGGYGSAECSRAAGLVEGCAMPAVVSELVRLPQSTIVPGV